MLTPAVCDLAFDRFYPSEEELRIEGVDLTDAGILAHVRTYPNAAGSPLKAYGWATPGGEGFRLARVDSGPVSVLVLAPGALATVSPPAEPDGDVRLAWDLVLTLAFEPPLRAAAGTFTIRAGVTK